MQKCILYQNIKSTGITCKSSATDFFLSIYLPNDWRSRRQCFFVQPNLTIFCTNSFFLSMSLSCCRSGIFDMSNGSLIGRSIGDCSFIPPIWTIFAAFLENKLLQRFLDLRRAASQANTSQTIAQATCYLPGHLQSKHKIINQHTSDKRTDCAWLVCWCIQEKQFDFLKLTTQLEVYFVIFGIYRYREIFTFVTVHMYLYLTVSIVIQTSFTNMYYIPVFSKIIEFIIIRIKYIFIPKLLRIASQRGVFSQKWLFKIPEKQSIAFLNEMKNLNRNNYCQL